MSVSAEQTPPPGPPPPERHQAAVSVCDSEVRGDGLRCSHLRVLLVFEVLVDGGVEVLGVALVQAVDLPPGLDPHVPLGQDELADGLSVKRKTETEE